MEKDHLHFDSGKSILLCKSIKDNRTRWAKKMEDIFFILDIIEDSNLYYAACEIDSVSGKFLAVNRDDGSTAWYIPGRPYLQQLFDKFLFIIFIDERDDFFLLKVDPEDGSKVWFHQTDNDLSEYSFRKDRILLTYKSGREEKLDPVSGKLAR